MIFCQDLKGLFLFTRVKQGFYFELIKSDVTAVVFLFMALYVPDASVLRTFGNARSYGAYNQGGYIPAPFCLTPPFAPRLGGGVSKLPKQPRFLHCDSSVGWWLQRHGLIGSCLLFRLI